MKERILSVLSLAVLLTSSSVTGMNVKNENTESDAYSPFSAPVDYDTSKVFTGDPAVIGLQIVRSHRPSQLPRNIRLLPGIEHINAAPSAPQLVHCSSSVVLNLPDDNERRQSDLTDNKKQ